MKTQYKPIAMRCTQEQFDSIKDRIPLPIEDIDSFEYYPYLRNDYFIGKSVSNSIVILKQNIEIHETFDGELFLDCCGRETQDVAYVNTSGFFFDDIWNIVKQLPLNNASIGVLQKSVDELNKLFFKKLDEQKDTIIKEYLKDKVWKSIDFQYEKNGKWLNLKDSTYLYIRLKPQPDYSKEKSLENELSCLGVVRHTNISKRLTPLQELITFMDFNRTGKGGKDFKGEAMAEAIRLLKREEEEIIKAFDKGNNQEFEDPEFWVNGEEYFNEKFKERFS